MRNAVNSVRTLAGLAAYPFTGTPSSGGVIKATDILELRAALNEARSTIGVPAVTYSNPTLGIGSAVRAADAQEIRNGTK